MRKIVAGLFISLDGVVESPERWQSEYFNDEMLAGIAAGVARADTILMGRRTYLQFAEMWPNRSGSPMADFMNNTPKHVVSSTLRPPLEWANAHLVTGDLAEAVTKLKEQPGKNIQVPGSPRLVAALLRDGLLDELTLSIHPIVVGSGMRLFDGITDQVRLDLVDSKTLSTGVVGVTYHPATRGRPRKDLT
jgi:dihydrofolate reductase